VSSWRNSVSLSIPRFIAYDGDTETQLQRSRNFADGSTGDQNYDQAKIPYSIGSIPICTDNDGLGGGETIVARVHVNTALRLQRWLGVQKRLYIVDAIKL
jgi:hypothetical protein